LTTVQVEAAVAGRKRAGSPEHPIPIELAPGPTMLRDLIGAIVRAEVTAFEDRAADERFVRVLTERSIEEGVSSGAIRSGGREIAAEVDTDEAVAVALLAQADGLYQVIVDDRPVDDLDEVLELRDGISVMFLRLVPLAGG
jgi:hypothetical protein